MVHEPINIRLNVRNEIKRISVNPLKDFLDLAYRHSKPGGIRDRYEYAYYLYMRSMERIFKQISTFVRYRKGPYYVRKTGGKFSPGQKKLAAKASELKPYFELDISTGLLHARILLDKTISLSRLFLKGSKLPSFNSFSSHKKFFKNKSNIISGHEEYIKYLCEETDWFDKPIKYIPAFV
jgi:hypothetical protein